MRVYLIRHAVTAETGRKLSGRTPGIDLSADGEAMAQTLADQLRSTRFESIYTSPIERCRQTAGFIAAGRNMRPRTTKAFIEADYGQWTGRTLKSLYRLKTWAGLMRSASQFRFPQGETLFEVQQRAVGEIEHLAQQHRRNVAIVSHADVIRTALAWYLGAPLDLFHRLDVLPASVSIVDVGPPVRVPVINHVADPGRWR
jgi:broad specificity phosphatase PhoE